ncbi:MAG: DUF4255 domain-containing protein [Candidatus Jettenia sp.]|uniref:Pvc16 N-terminal domain-containing protein n=1 Tax=Candidatus Jettenia caeni TaxID=247490 RepID=I3IIB1_9BACT|nr:Pvc16 family protein [Candidatus Jettenia sp. AMX1]MBC6928304.1 DUF4255 domain-containing protein [Candidatus Jettenia sp.]NUN21967.1 DUF4255 domain-containing protein [Candidatus Jettenia caeni]KAA0249935.1 MAG: DUF4255 domain-containing protein [Candidatus Jettenia sp. AMX1]MCE7880413.1 DUF4255 domain-containing protein [Candidatus Jettenia sp. AMX1]MCQ3926221.1 DUF4255 domain-containing protein [Candidatus Jettenia sp.]
MIDKLDSVLDHLFRSKVDLLKSGSPPTVIDGQIDFQPPDDAWITHVNGLGSRKALNVYLIDLRENVNLRSNEKVRSYNNGVISEELAPVQMDCHYLITAWSPASEQQGKTIEEHQLLYQVLAVLLNNRPIVPRKIFEPDPLPSNFPDILADAELPMTIVPAEGFPKLAEFWGTMGNNRRWKPGVYVTVTLPVILDKQISGPMVITRDIKLGERTSPDERKIKPGTLDELFRIGGQVTQSAGVPVEGASVMIFELGITTKTNKDGRYSIGTLRRGQYTLHAEFDTRVREKRITIPAKKGSDYNVEL